MNEFLHSARSAIEFVPLTHEQVFLILLIAVFSYWEIVIGMRPKYFYLIRHGRTLLNEANVKQGAEGKLSAVGEAQAGAVAQYLAPLRIERICSSPYERAVQTANIIRAAVHARIHTTPLLAERKNPSEVIGRDAADPLVLNITDAIDRSFHDDDFRFSDEENFSDLKKRARACMRYLGRQSKHRICVVTHHAFLKILLAYMTYGETLHASDFAKISYFNHAENGGVSICVYYPSRALFRQANVWEILSYNEQVSYPTQATQAV